MADAVALPQKVDVTEHFWITLKDGCRLAARLWLPKSAQQKPVPGILEYIPYRKRDGTLPRDELMHPYVAGHGYACVRVDMRGNGDSDGLMHDEYTARWTPDWIVVAPTGYGQVLWRYMGEQDVLDVLDDVQRHYPIDPQRVVLAGLSNGGVGTYAIGTRHAWRFSHVQAMAGAPSWLQYLGRTSAIDRQVVTPWSGLHLAENTANTRFYYYHGLTDGGPMRPEFVRAFSTRMRELGVPNNETWLDAGHDILNMAMRHGRRFEQLTAPRDPRPADVRLVSGDYRAARQHWIEVTRFAQFNTMGSARGRVNERALTLTTENISALRLHVSDMPFTGEVRVGFEVTMSVEPCASTPPRGLPGGRLTLRMAVPVTFVMP